MQLTENHSQAKTSKPISKKRVVFASVAAAGLIVAIPMSAKALDLGFLNQALAAVDQVFGIDSQQWTTEAITVFDRLSTLNLKNIDLNAVFREILSSMTGELGLPDPTVIGTEGSDPQEQQANQNLGIPSDSQVLYPEQARYRSQRQDNLDTAQVQAYSQWSAL